MGFFASLAGRCGRGPSPLLYPEIVFPALPYLGPPGDLRGDMGSACLWARPANAPGDGVGHNYMGIAPLNANPASYLALSKTAIGNLLALVIDVGGGPQLAMGAAAPLLSQNVWHHLAITWGRAGIAVRLDGAAFAALAPVNLGDRWLAAATMLIIDDGTANAEIERVKLYDRTIETELLNWIFQNERGYYGV